MVALYVTSSESGSGKTAVCAGLGKRWLSSGHKVAYLKPHIGGKTESTEHDTAVIKEILELTEAVDLLCPTFRDESQLKSGVKAAYDRVSSGKDVVIIEGMAAPSQASRHIVAALDARVIIVEGYSQELAQETNNYADFGENLLGIVLNKVPGSRLAQVRGETSAALAQAGVNLLGVLPEDRTLFALTVAELAEYLQGEIVSSTEQTAELVENFMMGAMCLDPGPIYFSQKSNKAAIIRSARPDMQMAALETSTRCLVLTGAAAINPVVRQQAAIKKVPIILAGDAPAGVAASIEDALGKTRFNQEKLPRLIEIMEQRLDFGAIEEGLGLARS